MAVACGAHIIFPPLEDPSFHCGHCLNAVFLCSCCGVQQGKDYVLAGLTPLPSCPTSIERLVRWAAITSAHPGTNHFDAQRFVRDMVDRNMLFVLLQERPRLGNMAEDHARKLGEPAEAGRLAALFAAGRLDGPPAAQLTALQAMCEGAMGKLVACDWAGMSPLEVALCQNAFQTSDPSRYPLGDPNLQLVYDVIGVLTTVHRWAFSTRGWHLRLEISAASATMTGSGGSMQHAWEQPNSPPGHASHFVPGGSLHKDISQVHLVAEGQQTGPSAAKCRARDPPQDLSSQALDNNSVPATPL